MKIYSGSKENLEILEKMHKSFTTKFGDICKLSDVLTLKSEEDFNKFKNHFGFNGKVEYYFSMYRTENQYIDIFIMTEENDSYCIYLKGSKISGKEFFVREMDKIFKSNGAKSYLDSGYRVNKFEKEYSSKTLCKMLNGKLNCSVKGEGAIELDCGLLVIINAFDNTTRITYKTL